MRVAALFVETDGVYFGLDDVTPYDKIRNAFMYRGPWPVVCHSPCERWGRYWHGGPSAKVRRVKGDDGGAFEFALGAVREYGGVLEHPEASHAWDHFGLRRPKTPREWWPCPSGGHVCQVEQGHYGHRARKKTWLYAFGIQPADLPNLIWGPSTGERLDEGFHSAEERRAARAAGIKPRPRLSTKENLTTPVAFRDVLLGIARLSARRSP